MKNLIQLDSVYIQPILSIILKDRTSNKNIIFATDNYKCDEQEEITVNILNTINLKTRVEKTIEEQKSRSKKKAEVFTPSWLCNKMNNFLDEDWFGIKNVFNIENEKSWTAINEKIVFPNDKKWTDYIKSTRLEITCGEAPYLVSRYDTTTGNIIDVQDRIGMLDRKLRIVNENTYNYEDWFKWIINAYKSIFGYEFQGDNLIIARINLLLTYVDNLKYRWNREPQKEELETIADIISWNVFQMNGLTDKIPFSETYCKIKDWEDGEKQIEFRSLKKMKEEREDKE